MNFENDHFYGWTKSIFNIRFSALSNNICNIYRNERHYSILLLLHICTTTMCLCVWDSCIFRTERYDGKALGSNVSPLWRLQVQVRVQCFFFFLIYIGSTIFSHPNITRRSSDKLAVHCTVIKYRTYLSTYLYSLEFFFPYWLVYLCPGFFFQNCMPFQLCILIYVSLYYSL